MENTTPQTPTPVNVTDISANKRKLTKKEIEAAKRQRRLTAELLAKLDYDEDSLVSLRENLEKIAKVHEEFYSKEEVICTKLGYAHAALSDLIIFLTDIKEGREEFQAIPPKPVLKLEDKELYTAEDGDIFIKKVPSDFKDQAYVTEWFRSFLFPKLHEILGKEYKGELNVLANFDENKELNITFTRQFPEEKEPKVTLENVYADGSINLSALAKACLEA